MDRRPARKPLHHIQNETKQTLFRVRFVSFYVLKDGISKPPAVCPCSLGNAKVQKEGREKKCVSVFYLTAGQQSSRNSRFAVLPQAAMRKQFTQNGTGCRRFHPQTQRHLAHLIAKALRLPREFSTHDRWACGALAKRIQNRDRTYFLPSLHSGKRKRP